ncbi:MAG: TldD/PmbA family protein, partial [Hyphomicrobiales bacterium]|nr:TldD/PmbA family protein [Hyphomicrobiales bacterium]
MDLKDTSHLEERAAALLDAAKAAGADAADAVAVRGVSLGVEVREGILEESERSEGDSLSLRVFIGKKQAVVSTNETAMEGFAELAARAVAIAGAAPEDPYAGLADPSLLAITASRIGGEDTLDLLDAHIPDADDLQN